MLHRQGFTLMEIIFVLIIIGVAVAFSFPNFTTSTEQARALNAKNNLLTIYTAQRNYYNNNGGIYCLTGTSASSTCAAAPPTGIGDSNCADKLAAINCNLSLNIQDDGTYKYACPPTGGAPLTCVATRTSIATNNTIVLTLNLPIQLSGSTKNPSCNLTANWCP
jgi:prepilin-type N-terminal cleavage/methylation domain-containing protein